MNESESFYLEVSRVFKISKNGVQVVLSEEEMKQMLKRAEVRALIKEILDASQLPKNLIAYVPPGFVELFKSACDPKSPFKDTIFIYYRNNETMEYGFRRVRGEGEQPRFYRLGRISDPYSTIGKFLRSYPLGEELTKTEMTKMRLIRQSAGRELKGILDVLEYTHYLEKRRRIANGGHEAYKRTNKMDGLEDLSKNELEKVHTIPPTPFQ